MNYTLTHCHTHFSNGILLDSTTSPHKMIRIAKEKGLKGVIFTEHGQALGWYTKMKACKEAGMKFVYAMEGYIINTLDDKKSHHILVYALNYEGFREINELISTSYQRDGHFHGRPRFYINELMSCNNVAISTACMAGIDLYSDMFHQLRMTFGLKGRMFIEIQPHNHPEQRERNEQAMAVCKKYPELKIIVSNDVHNADQVDAMARELLQKQRGMNFTDEDSFDITIKTYDEMLASMLECGINYENAYRSLDNTNLLYDMCEEFEVDKSFKYPKIYDNPTEEIIDRCMNRILELNVDIDKYSARVMEELEVYQKVMAEDYIILFSDWLQGIKSEGVRTGISRGSASGSLIAYLLRVVEIDPIIFNLYFFRFMNPERVSLADIDTDLAGKDRKKAKDWFRNHPRLNCADIITFGTFGEKASIDAVCRVRGYDNSEFYKNLDEKSRDEYEEFFNDVESMNGCIRSIGKHASGLLVTAEDIRKTIGIITMEDKENGGFVEVSQLNMKELDALNYVKADILGLDNIGVINDTYDMIGKKRPTPQEFDFNDDFVWRDISKSPFGIFQFSNELPHQRLGIALGNINDTAKISVMSMMSGLIRPSGASIVDLYQSGVKYDWGHKAINDLFSMNSGYIVYQEDIMRFLIEFCGYSGAEADTMRRAIGKKDEALLNKCIVDIRQRFVPYFTSHYEASEQLANDILDRFVKISVDASSYGFSLNHSLPYSMTGYMGGYLRAYYPLEYTTCMINNFIDDKEKVKEAYEFVKTHTNSKIQAPKLGFSKSEYSCSREDNVIYEGLGSYKGLASNAVESVSKLPSAKNYLDFFSMLQENFHTESKIGQSNFNILIEMDFFRDFGKQQSLLWACEIFFNGIPGTKIAKYSITKKQQAMDDKMKAYREYISQVGWEIDRDDLSKAYSQLTIKNSTDIDVDTNECTLAYVSEYEKNKWGKITVWVYNLLTKQNEEYRVKDAKLLSKFSKGDLVQLTSVNITPRKAKNSQGRYVEIPGEYVNNLEDLVVILTKSKKK